MIIGYPNTDVQTRRATQNECLYSCFLSKNQPKEVEESLLDPHRIIGMQDKLKEFNMNKVWKLVPRSNNRTIIGAKWVF